MKSRLDLLEHDYQNRNETNTTTPVFDYRKALTVFALAAMAAFFGYSIYSYQKWPPAEYSDPLVYNLTKSKVIWDVHYGKSDRCGKIDCHVTTQYPQENFERKQELPIHEFPLKDLKPGDSIYYRTKIVIPPETLTDRKNSPLVFHVPMLWGDNYELYINENLIDGGRGDTIHIPLPDPVYEENILHISFKITPGKSEYQGIANYGAILIGEKQRMKGLQNISERLRVTYYIWLFLPRLAFSLFFAMVFLAFSKNKENFYFLIYSCLSALKILLLSDLGADLTPTWLPRIKAGLLIDILASVMLMKFFVVYYRRGNQRFISFNNLAQPVAWIALTMISLNALYQFPLDYFRQVSSFIRLLAIGIGVQLSLENAVYLATKNTGKKRLENASTLFLILGATWIISGVGFCIQLLGLQKQIFVLAPGFLIATSDLLMLLFMSGAVAYEFGNDANNRAVANNALQTYVGKKAGQKILGHTDGPLANVQRQVTVLFTDIRSFTTLSETHPAPMIIETLNEYFGAMEPIISMHGGSIDKFIGDSIMAEWGGAGEEGDPYLAVLAAVDMRAKLLELNQNRERLGLFPLAVGIGIHFGPAISGTVGSKDRREFTVIGDTVNVAARIQDQTKELGCDIIVSEAVVQQCHGKLLTNKCQNQSLRGRGQSVGLYRLLAVRTSSGEFNFGSTKLQTLIEGLQAKENLNIDLDLTKLTQLKVLCGMQPKPPSPEEDSSGAA